MNPQDIDDLATKAAEALMPNGVNIGARRLHGPGLMDVVANPVIRPVDGLTAYLVRMMTGRS